MKNPSTRREWRLAVELAAAHLLLDDARLYGLVVGGPSVNRQRCLEVLAKGRARGVTPRRDPIDVLRDEGVLPR